MATRAEMKSRVKRPLRERFAREVGFNRLLPRPKLMRTFGKITRFYQRSGVRDITKKIGVMKALPKRYTYFDESLPTMGEDFFQADGRVVKPIGPIKARVALLGGCVMSMMHADTMNATLRVLRPQRLRGPSTSGTRLLRLAEHVCRGTELPPVRWRPTIPPSSPYSR